MTGMKMESVGERKQSPEVWEGWGKYFPYLLSEAVSEDECSN